MTKYEEIKKYLEESPRARERRNKYEFISWLLSKRYGLEARTFNSVILKEILVEAASYDRIWR